MKNAGQTGAEEGLSCRQSSDTPELAVSHVSNTAFGPEKHKGPANPACGTAVLHKAYETVSIKEDFVGKLKVITKPGCSHQHCAVDVWKPYPPLQQREFSQDSSDTASRLSRITQSSHNAPVLPIDSTAL